MPKKIIHASILICDSVLYEEKAHLPSLIRVCDAFTLSQQETHARFSSYVHIHCEGLDLLPHTLVVQMLGYKDGGWESIVEAPPHEFRYGYHAENSSGPGATLLFTRFNQRLSELEPLPRVFYLQARVDEELVAQTPLTLRRLH